jgi:hypothetical protein
VIPLLRWWSTFGTALGKDFRNLILAASSFSGSFILISRPQLHFKSHFCCDDMHLFWLLYDFFAEIPDINAIYVVSGW